MLLSKMKRLALVFQGIAIDLAMKPLFDQGLQLSKSPSSGLAGGRLFFCL
jgi:hypothetical protein